MSKLGVYDYPKLLSQLEIFTNNLIASAESLPEKSPNLEFQLEQFCDSFETFKVMYTFSNGFRILTKIPKEHDRDMDPKIREIIEMDEDALLDENNSLKLILSIETIVRRLKQLSSFKWFEIEFFHPYKECWKEIKFARELYSQTASLNSGNS